MKIEIFQIVQTTLLSIIFLGLLFGFLFSKIKNIKEFSYGKLKVSSSEDGKQKPKQKKELLEEYNNSRRVALGLRLFDENANYIKNKMLSLSLKYLCSKKRQSPEIVIASKDYSHLILAFEVCIFACVEEAKIMLEQNHLHEILSSSDLIKKKVGVYRRICQDRLNLYKCGFVDLNIIHKFADELDLEMESCLKLVLKEVCEYGKNI